MALVFLVVGILPELCHPDELMQNQGNGLVRGVRIDMKSFGLPIGAGLGSSAAFSVASAGALVRLRQKLIGDIVDPADVDVSMMSTDSETHNNSNNNSKNSHPIPQSVLSIINGWAFAAEIIIHGNPSGLDNATSCYGGALQFSKADGKIQFNSIERFPKIPILLTNTKVPRLSLIHI